MNELLKRGFSAYKIVLGNKLATSIMMLFGGLMLMIGAISGSGNDTKTLPSIIAVAGAIFASWSFYRIGYIKAKTETMKRNERDVELGNLILQIYETIVYLIVCSIGVFLLLNENFTNQALNLMTGGFTIFNGIVGVIGAIKNREKYATFGWKFMLGLTIPLQASIVPVYVVLSKLHWLNKYSTLIVPYSAFTLSMSILICTGFMVDIPYDLDEAAIIDGCGLFGTFFKIIMPLMKPALSTVGIYAYLQCWNEFMFANVFISDQKHRTLPVGIKALSGAYTTDWGPIGAALVIATFPTLIAYVFLSRKIQDSFIAGAVKG